MQSKTNCCFHVKKNSVATWTLQVNCGLSGMGESFAIALHTDMRTLTGSINVREAAPFLSMVPIFQINIKPIIQIA